MQGLPLLSRTGISRITPGIQPAFVGDSQGVAVVAPGMAALSQLGKQRMDVPVTRDQEVVAMLPEAGLMVSLQPLNRIGPVAPGSGAVNNNQVYTSHFGDPLPNPLP